VPEAKLALLVAVLLVLLSSSFWMLSREGEGGGVFELEAERVLMSGWRMEPAEYGGLPVTKITAESSLLTGLSLSPLGTSSPTAEVRKLIVYARRVEGTAGGVEAGWEGRNVPLEVLELLLPPDNAEMTGVRMEILHLEAENMVLPSLRVEAPSSRPRKVSMPSVRMKGWSMKGPLEVEVSGRKVKVTELSVAELSGEMYLGYGSCVLGGKVEQKGAEIWASEVAGEVMGFRAGWRGDQAPQEAAIRNLAGDPATLLNVDLKLLYLFAENTVLREVEMRVLG
jgi:hypothetical protein